MTEELNTEINLRNVRISYPHLFEPKVFEGNTGKPKYSAKFMIPKTDTETVKKIGDLMKAMAAASFKDKRLPPADKLCMRDGDLTNKEEDAGYWLLSASDDRRPVVVDKDRTPLVAEDDVIYPGCVVNAKVNLWAQDNKYGRRINANLLGVQFAKDGDRLGNGRVRQAAEDMFDEVADFGGEEDDSPF